MFCYFVIRSRLQLLFFFFFFFCMFFVKCLRNVKYTVVFLANDYQIYCTILESLALDMSRFGVNAAYVGLQNQFWFQISNSNALTKLGSLSR